MVGVVAGLVGLMVGLAAGVAIGTARSSSWYSASSSASTSVAAADVPAADAPAAGTTAPDSSAPPTAPPLSNPAKAAVGAPLTLDGIAEDTRIEVTLVKVETSVTGGEFDVPATGTTYRAAQFRLKNVGTQAYSDFPTNSARMLDVGGRRFEATIVASTSAGQLLPTPVRIEPGTTALGWIVFEVPKGAKVVSVQFASDSGYGGVGEWRL